MSRIQYFLPYYLKCFFKISLLTSLFFAISACGPSPKSERRVSVNPAIRSKLNIESARAKALPEFTAVSTNPSRICLPSDDQDEFAEGIFLCNVIENITDFDLTLTSILSSSDEKNETDQNQPDRDESSSENEEATKANSVLFFYSVNAEVLKESFLSASKFNRDSFHSIIIIDANTQGEDDLIALIQELKSTDISTVIVTDVDIIKVDKILKKSERKD